MTLYVPISQSAFLAVAQYGQSMTTARHCGQILSADSHAGTLSLLAGIRLPLTERLGLAKAEFNTERIF